MTRVFKCSKTLNLDLHLIHRRFSSLCDQHSSVISSYLSLEINLHQLGSHLHFF
ncbi:hypothetical protein HanPI659440_Chr05g0191601 [Helianthus annuus]|uniref:Uncharacterized protein n=1 Tax=Helianthus annuus TaxID=4232 RepID=A0A9K3IX75_HELAN|nr:hypothetical protein HanXRQr2_Chr05g0201301 [Helianthus annuus]KAJ0569372.1 hypothetical protein HanHA300_Chr05g0165411 [Helianthus annuus]KAJ0575825.1 hypothetical protein HanIR_Chr05g0217211 [Helianthus annuus]KAJ0583682.1 hypothetical protein HanHA89_Chr05g0179461 [Helianthus annuus]KAJ0749410.1 hypothetical protein HanLR1_Chr05g0169531 [Helianthus annuus]